MLENVLAQQTKAEKSVPELPSRLSASALLHPTSPASLIQPTCPSPSTINALAKQVSQPPLPFPDWELSTASSSRFLVESPKHTLPTEPSHIPTSKHEASLKSPGYSASPILDSREALKAGMRFPLLKELLLASSLPRPVEAKTLLFLLNGALRHDVESRTETYFTWNEFEMALNMMEASGDIEHVDGLVHIRRRRTPSESPALLMETSLNEAVRAVSIACSETIRNQTPAPSAIGNHRLHLFCDQIRYAKSLQLPTIDNIIDTVNDTIGDEVQFSRDEVRRIFRAMSLPIEEFDGTVVEFMWFRGLVLAAEPSVLCS
jgi:hypothetical protein